MSITCLYMLFLLSQTAKQVQVRGNGGPRALVMVVSDAKLGASFCNDRLDLVEVAAHDIGEKMVDRLMV